MPNYNGKVSENQLSISNDISQDLAARFHNAPENDYIAVCLLQEHSPVFTTKFFRVEHLSQAAQYIAMQDEQTHVYVRMSTLIEPLAQGRGSQTQSRHCSVVWVECDIHNGDTFSKQDIIDAAERMPHPPSFVGDSGGGIYFYWRLKEPCKQWPEVRAVNNGLRELLSAFGADSCFNTDRLLRVMGTFNAKPERQCYSKIVADYPDRIYDIDELPYLSVDEMPSIEAEAEDLPADFEKLGQIAPRLWMRITSEDTAIAAGAPVNSTTGRVDRSKNDWYIAHQLLRRGFTLGQTYHVLAHPDYFSGSKFRERRDDRYIRHTLAQVRSALQIAANAEKMKNPNDVIAFLREHYHFLNYGGSIFQYDETRGVFTPGEIPIGRTTRALMGTAWSIEKWKTVIQGLKIDTFQNDLSVELPPTDFINTTSGMLNVKTGEIQNHAPGFHSLNQMPVDYDPKANSDAVDSLVAGILQPEDINTWWECAGYAMLPYCFMRMICILAGHKRTGKSQLLLGMGEVLGQSNIAYTSLHSLANDKFSVPSVIGKLANIDHDSQHELTIESSAVLKKLAAGDPLSFQQKHEKEANARPYVKLFAATNRAFTLRSPDSGFYDRIVLLPCDNVHDEGGDNTVIDIYRKIMEDPRNRSAWLNRSLEGVRRLIQRERFTRSHTASHAFLELRSSTDTVYAFWQECFDFSKEALAQGDYARPRAQFYTAYKLYCIEAGQSPTARRKFYERTAELIREGLVLIDEVTRHNQKIYRGARLKEFYSFFDALSAHAAFN